MLRTERSSFCDSRDYCRTNSIYLFDCKVITNFKGVSKIIPIFIFLLKNLRTVMVFALKNLISER